ncbi:MAG: hypothetical protein Q9226_001619 [Calogaya cf. arnoldii]
MAVQGHNIPWTLFASNFKYKEVPIKNYGITNYYAKSKPHPGKDIVYFVNAFVKTVEEHSASERKKYADDYTKPDPNEILISEDASRRIGRTVYRYLVPPNLPQPAWHTRKRWTRTIRYTGKICHHRGPNSQCQCPVRYEDRKASMFSIAHPPDEDSSDFHAAASKLYYHEHQFKAMIKTLLLHGEMDVLFKLAAYVPERLTSNWTNTCRFCTAPFESSDLGWRYVRDLALYPFICLNVLHAMRMASGHDVEPDSQDYRRTKAYQEMLLHCTGYRQGCYRGQSAFDPETYPHRQFLGIVRGQYPNLTPDGYSETDKYTPYGKLPLQRLEWSQYLSNQHLPTASDVDEVFLTLRKAGLPTELVSEILERADYRWQRRSLYSDDPMHPSNREELLKYLRFCWVLLVRCDLLAKACGKRIDWANDISLCIHSMFGVKDHALRRMEWYSERGREPDLMEPSRPWITWLAV